LRRGKFKIFLDGLFGRFDQRIVRELATQRRYIVLGLACTAIASLTSPAAMLLARNAQNSITDLYESYTLAHPALAPMPSELDAPARMQMARAKILDSEGLNREAELLCAKILKRFPNDPQSKTLLSTLRRSDFDLQNGQASLTDKNSVPGVVNLKDGLAQVHKLIASGDRDLAETECLKVLARYPNEPEANTLLANIKASNGMSGLIFTCVIVVILFGFRYWFVRGQTFYLSIATNRLSADLRIRLLDKLLNLPVSYFNDRRTGAIQSVLLNDVNVYQNAVGIIRDSIQGPISATAAFVTILYLQWRIAILALMLVPLVGFVIDRNQKRMRRAQTIVQENLAEVSANTFELLNGIRIVKAFNAESNVKANYRGLIENTYGSQLIASRITASLRPMTDLIGASGLSLAFALCGTLALKGMLTPGSVLAIAYGMDTINQGFRSVGNVTNTFATVQSASERIYSEVLERPEEPELLGGRTLENPIGHIQFENVSFSYPDGTEALKNVSFEIRPDTSLALVGPSGAGKSTIADLLLRFYDPTSGRILLDGVNIRDLNIQWLRRLIGVVPQQTFLFAGTIEENVRLGAPEADDESMKIALEQASAQDFVREMSQRSTLELGERGIKLSGGQMQRVAIARALIKKPTVLLLDEATSALDANSEKAVTEALEGVMRTRTTLFIAHRLTTAARADKIVFLSQGQVLESGSHAELLEANSTYAALFRAFSGGILS
jgi:subfamily B ATP-binding cassette protein MsbA